MASLIENRVIRNKDTNSNKNFHEFCCNSREGSQENSFFLSSKKELYIYVMDESDPVEKKRSIDDRGETGVSFTSTGWW